MLATDSNKHLIHTIFTGLNENRLAVLDGHPGFWETRQIMPLAHRGFADWQEIVPACQVAEGDQVFSYAAIALTHRGDFGGLAPTGQRVSLELFSLDQVIDGTVVEHNSASTWADVFRQLAVPDFAGWPVRQAAPLAPPQPLAPSPTGKAIIARLLTDLVAGRATLAAAEPGLTALAAELTAIRAACPDLRLTIVSQLAEGDLVATRATLRGTQRGPLWGLAASGQTLTWDHFSLIRLDAGQAVAARGTADWNAALAQLGRFPGG